MKASVPAPVFSLLVLMVGLVGTPSHARGIDCRDAILPAERTICATPALDALDRRIARRYAALSRAMDLNAAAALAADQRWFLKARDRAVEHLSGDDLVVELADRYAARVAFLDDIDPRPAEGAAGTWGNVAGRLSLTAARDGGYALDASGADPALQGWSCEVSGTGGAEQGGVSIRIATPPGPGWTLVAIRKGAMLWVDERPDPPDAGSRPYCGANGMIGGSYFRMRDVGAPGKGRAVGRSRPG